MRIVNCIYNYTNSKGRGTDISMPEWAIIVHAEGVSSCRNAFFVFLQVSMFWKLLLLFLY